MKIFKYAVLILLPLLSRCDDADGPNTTIESTVYFIQAGTETVTVDEEGEDIRLEYEIYRAGYNKKGLVCGVSVSEYAIEKHNEIYGTSYELLDARYYHIHKREFELTNENYRATVPVSVYSERILTDLGKDRQYALPLSLTSIDRGTVNADKNSVIVIIRFP